MPQDPEHFERRLVEESSNLRLEVAELRTDMRGEFGAIRTDMAAELGAMRTEMATALGGMRVEIAAIRADIATNKFELLKWAFAFWVGQLLGVAGIVGLLLRMMPAR